MSEYDDALWRDFPKTLSAFEERFPDEASCWRYLVQCRWGDHPTCPRCGSQQLSLVSRKRFMCKRCSHQTTVTAGTVMENTHKPLKLWFRAIWEVCVHRPGISAKDLQRILGFGSYETAWTWLHKLRRLMVDAEREALTDAVQMDESFLSGARRGEAALRGGKRVILIAAEPQGRIRLAHAPNNDEASVGAFADQSLASDAAVTTDGLASYNPRSLGDRPHRMTVQSPQERSTQDAVQACHRAASLCKRWWLGTHHGAISAKHLQAYLDEFTFRFNRRKTQGVGKLVARVLQNIKHYPPLTMRTLVDDMVPCRLFASLETRG